MLTTNYKLRLAMFWLRVLSGAALLVALLWLAAQPAFAQQGPLPPDGAGDAGPVLAKDE